MSDKLQEFYNASYPILRKVTTQLILKSLTPLEQIVCILQQHIIQSIMKITVSILKLLTALSMLILLEV